MRRGVSSVLTRIVVTGGQGSLASSLKPYFPFAEYPSKAELNVADSGSCKAYFSARSVDLILHLAAETHHSAPSESYVMNNIVGTANVVLWAKRKHARLVYTSTDYVYPGTAGGYTETATLQPIGAYGMSKLGGEMAVQQYDQSLTIRGSWYSRLDYPQAATDAFTSRIPITDAARLIAPLSTSTLTGVINVGGVRRSVYEIVSTEFNPRTRPVTRVHITGQAYPIPADTSLDTTVLHDFLRSHR